MIISKSTVRRASIYITFSNVSICSMWNNESVSKPQCCISCLSKHRLSRTQNTTKLIDLTWPGLTFIRTPDPKHTAPFHFMSRSKSGSRTQFLLKEDHCRNRFILYMRFCSVSYSSVQSKIIIYFWAWEWLPLCLNEIASPPRFLFYFIFFLISALRARWLKLLTPLIPKPAKLPATSCSIFCQSQYPYSLYNSYCFTTLADPSMTQCFVENHRRYWSQLICLSVHRHRLRLL